MRYFILVPIALFIFLIGYSFVHGVDQAAAEIARQKFDELKSRAVVVDGGDCWYYLWSESKVRPKD
jgi:hypothetical protein